MEEEKIIKCYFTIIDSYRFGYEVYRYYITLQNASTAKKEEILKHFSKYEDMWVVDTSKGRHDIVLVIWIKNVSKFYKFWDKSNEIYGDYFADKVFSVYLQASDFPFSYLLLDEFSKSDRDKHEHKVGGEKSSYDIDWIDYQILDILSTNARIPLVNIAEKVKCSSQNVSYRIKNLQKIGIIQAFRTGIDSKKIEFEHYKVDIWLKAPSKRRKIWDYIKYNPNVTFLNTSAGYADIEIEFNIESIDRIFEIMDNLSTKFPNAVRKYTYFSGSSTPYKIRCLPELSEKDFKKN
jgi:DNA-binding Lrp family transcriptional regulator